MNQSIVIEAPDVDIEALIGDNFPRWGHWIPETEFLHEAPWRAYCGSLCFKEVPPYLVVRICPDCRRMTE